MEPNQRGSERSFHYDTLYAESRDGITWTKPELDLFIRDGRKTTIVIHQERETAVREDVLFDAAARDPAHRFIGFVKTVPPGETQRCIVRMHSPDGRRWTLAENAVSRYHRRGLLAGPRRGAGRARRASRNSAANRSTSGSSCRT